MKSLLRASTALVAVVSLLQPTLITYASAASLVTAQPIGPYTPQTLKTYIDAKGVATASDSAVVTNLIRQKIKYVFVIFNENRSFDSEYGTFPGVNGLFADSNGAYVNAVAKTNRTPASETQSYTDVGGKSHTATPFRIGPDQNSTFKDSTDHSHTGLASKIDVQSVNGVLTAQMDGFAQDEYTKYAGTQASPKSPAAQAEGAEFANLVMAHVDCETIPFFWKYASNFTVFDNIFATEDTPSTPNAIAMLAGQAGETQWVLHPGANGAALGYTGTISGAILGTTYSGTATTQGPPLVNDPNPWWGSEYDTTVNRREPAGKDNYAANNIASNLTFASLPLSMMGNWANWITGLDNNPSFDLADVQDDIAAIQATGNAPTAWRWYQNGYDFEPTDAALAAANDTAAVATHLNYVSHHSAPQYFGYIANNPAEQDNIRGENDFFKDIPLIGASTLPGVENGGVFYIRGGYENLKHPAKATFSGELPGSNFSPTAGQPPVQNPNYPNPAGLTNTELTAIAGAKAGDDDHPSYSDSQLSEAMAARVIDSVIDAGIWDQSAIIITYDESDGLYDHVPPRILSWGPDGLPLSRGVRIPLILISPYANAHAVSHAEGDHNAVIETINAIFNLPALSSLPNEALALEAGDNPLFNQFTPDNSEQLFLGPRDTNSSITDSLLSGFDIDRLKGTKPLLPASLAYIRGANAPSAASGLTAAQVGSVNEIDSFPHFGGKGAACQAIGVTPTDLTFTTTKEGTTITISDPPPAGPTGANTTGFNTLPSTLPAYNTATIVPTVGKVSETVRKSKSTAK